MTADSLPPRTAESFGVGSRPAAEASLISDLIGRAEAARAAASGDRVPVELDLVERAFGRQVFDLRARSGIEAARERASRLWSAAGGPSETIAVAFASDLFASLAVERRWRSRDVDELVAKLAQILGTSSEALSVELLVGSLRAPQLLELPPIVALEVQLSMLLALGPVFEASLWMAEEDGRPTSLVAIGQTATTRRFRATARRALDGRSPDSGERGTIVAVPIRRWQSPWGALVARTRSRTKVGIFLDEAAAAMSPIVERDFLLQRSTAREHSLVSASERRLGRLGFDLHDGALQHIAALAADIQVIRRSIRAGMTEPNQSTVFSQLDTLEATVFHLDRVLRELAHSLEPTSLLQRPLPRVIQSEVAALTERTGIEVNTRIAGDFGAMTTSQKIALIRVVQEALTNIREHSNAKNVRIDVAATRSCVEVHIEDDGEGFEIARTLLDAAKRGRLGLIGSSERVRLLGGTFDVRSRPGGPTRVSLSLPRWQPLARGEQAPQDVAAF